MLYALRLAGGTGGVEQEQRMFGLDPFGFAALGLLTDKLVPPDIARRIKADIVTGALEHQYFAQRLAAVHQRFIDSLLEIDDVSAAMAAVRRERKGGAEGTGGSVRVCLGGRR